MAAGFVIGSATFTSGSNVVSGVTLTQNTLANFASGTQVKVGTDPVVDVVEATEALSVNSFELRNNWPHSTGTYDFMANFVPEGIRDAVTAFQSGLGDFNAAIDSFGTASTADVTTSATDTTADRLLKVGADEDQFSSATKSTIEAARDGGIGLTTPVNSSSNANFDYAGFTYHLSTDSNIPIAEDGYTITNSAANGFGGGMQIFIGRTSNRMFFRRANFGYTDWFEVWHTNNTTVDGSGFIKEASPIVKLFADYAEFNNQCPSTAAFEKIGTGNYLIKGTLGFAQNGWYIETPKDANNNVKFYTKYWQLDDGTIEIKTFEPNYSTGKVTGTVPMDITAGRWIDLRLEPDPVDTQNKKD